MTEVSILRLNALRAGYLLLVVGLGLIIWPSILDPAQQWDFSRGVVVSMLGGMSLLAALGLRHPLAMLPILFFEIAWKTIWLFRVALPAWQGGTLDETITQNTYECALIIVLFVVIPWDHVVRAYMTIPGDPWWSRASKPVAA